MDNSNETEIEIEGGELIDLGEVSKTTRGSFFGTWYEISVLPYRFNQ